MKTIKTIQYVASVVLVMAGILLLCAPAHAAAPGQSAFQPTRFTMTDEGTPGKPDVLMIPGLASSWSVFDAEAQLLAPNYHLHRLQMDGFAGRAAGPNASGPILVPVVEEIHRYLAARHMHPVVIGHSLGGLLALMLVDAHPEDVSKVLIVDTLPFYGLVFDPQATVENAKPQAEAIRDQMLKLPDDQFAVGAGMAASGMVKDPEGLKLVKASSIASDRTVFLNAMFEDLQTDLRPVLPKIKTPVLVLYPYDATLQGPDPAKVRALYTGAYSTMPNATLKEIDDSRHFIMYDQPAAFDLAVEAFLKP